MLACLLACLFTCSVCAVRWYNHVHAKALNMLIIRPNLHGPHGFDSLHDVMQISWAATAAPLTLLLVSLP